MSEPRVAIHRSFVREVEGPLRALPSVSVETLDELSYGRHMYPLLCAQYPHPCRQSADLPAVLISAGVHGDEPAGVHAALDFLRELAPAYAHEFRFVVFPCINPSGYEATRWRPYQA